MADFFSQFSSQKTSQKPDFFSQFNKEEEDKPDFFSQFSGAAHQSVWGSLSPSQKLATTLASPLTALLPEGGMKDTATALVNRGLDSTSGFVYGLGELMADNPNPLNPLSVILSKTIDSGEVPELTDQPDSDRKTYARNEMTGLVDEMIEQAKSESGMPNTITALDWTTRIGAPMATGAVGGGGLSTLASAGMKAAGLPNIGRLTTANVLGGLLEGTVQGIGDRPDDPLKGGAWGGAFGTGGALLGERLSALSRARLEKAARARLKGQYDPSAIAVDDITLNDRLMPEGATGEVIQLPKLDFDGAKDPSFDSGPFNVEDELAKFRAMQEPEIEFVDPSVSLSGHSSLDTASTEAINRMKAGVSFFGMDPGGGIYPIANTVDAIDAPIRPGHVKIQMNADGSKSVVSGRPNATQTRSISDGDFTIKEEVPELVGELELDLDGPSRFSPEVDDQIESIARQFEEKMRGTKTEKAVAESVGEVEGTLTWFDNLISTLKSLKADQPNQPHSRVMKESGKWSGKRLPVRHLSTLETIIRKVQGQLIKQGSIGGLKRNVSLAAAAAEQTTEEGQKFVKFFTDLLWNQKADAEAMIVKGNDLIISIQEKMIQVAKDSGIPYSQINESLRRAHIRNDYSEIPDEELKGLAQQFGKFLWEDGGKSLAAHHNDPKIAKGIIYRGINYLHDSYLGLKVEPEKWLNNRAIEDPESFKKVMSWATRKLIEADNVPKNPDGSTNFALLEENATGLVTQLLLKSREGTASVPLRGATSSIDFDPLKTTQGEIETRFTDLLDSTAEKMRLEAEGLGEGAVYTRPKIDSVFEPFLENVPEESARRIRNTYTKLVLDKAGISLPPGEKVDYQVIRNLIDEETSERLFREAIREEDMPEYLRKFLGGRSGFIESAQESLGKIAHNVSVINMYKQMTDAGLEAGVLSPVPGPGWVQVSSPSKLGFGSGFGDIYAPPQLAKVMNDSIDAADKIGLVNRLYNTMKLGKILTIPSMMRNVVSGVWDSVANGEFLNPKWWESMGTSRAAAVKGILNGNDQMTKAALANPAMRDAIYKTFRVDKYLNDPSFAPAFIDLVKKNFFQGGSEREVQMLAEIVARQEAGQGDFSGQILQEMAGVFARVYQSPDEFFKINAYATRLSELKWAEGPSPTLDKLDDVAAEMVKDTYQHYDYTPPIARSLSKLPLGPTFITFPIEKLRNTKNLVTETVWYLEQAANAAVKEGDLPKSLRYTTLGTKKMAGMAAGLYMAYEAAKETNEFLFGMDDEKQAALSEIVQFRGSKGSPIIYLDYDPQKHTAEFIDFSGVNPFPHVAASIRILDDTGKDWDQKLEEIKDELSQIYIPTGIFTKAIAEAATGRSVRSVTDIGNSPRYDTNPNAPGGSMWPPFGDASPTTEQEQAGRTLYRFYRNTAPGVLTQGEALGRAATGSEFGSRKFSLAGEAMYYMTGLRPTQVDLTTGMKFAVRENKDQLSDLRQSWVNGARGIPEGDIKSFAELRKTKQAELDRLMKDARYFSSVAQRIDFSYEDIDRMFEASDSRVYTKKIREAILDGYDIGIEDLWNYE